MAQTLTSLLVHIVFSTKLRLPLIYPEIEANLFAYMEHHRKVTFQEELLQFLKEYEIDYDERYLWN